MRPTIYAFPFTGVCRVCGVYTYFGVVINDKPGVLNSGHVGCERCAKELGWQLHEMGEGRRYAEREVV